jgi:hypothetical protein
MDTDASNVVESDADILTFEVPDDALERAAVAIGVQVTTIGVCTHWYHCSWPQ